MSDKLGTGWVNWAEVPFDPGQGGGEAWNLDSPSTCTSNSNNSYNHQYRPNEDHHVVTYNSHLPQAADIVSETNGISSNSHYQNDSVMIPQNILSSKSTEERSLATTLREAISISTWDPFNPFSTTDQMENDFTYQQLLTSPHSLTCQPNSEVVEVYEPPPTASYVDLMPPTTTTTTSSPGAIPDYQIMESVAPEPDSPPTISSLDPPSAQPSISTITTTTTTVKNNLHVGPIDALVDEGEETMEEKNDSSDCYVNTQCSQSAPPQVISPNITRPEKDFSTETYRQKLRKRKQPSETTTNDQSNNPVLKIMNQLLTDEKRVIIKKLFKEEPWQTSDNAEISAILGITPVTLRKWLWNRKINVADHESEDNKSFHQHYLKIRNVLLPTLKKWKSQSPAMQIKANQRLHKHEAQIILRKTTINTSKLTYDQHFALLMYVCEQVPNFDTSWASHISSVIGHRRSYLLHCQKNYQQLKKERKNNIEVPADLAAILDELVNDIKKTPVLKPPKPKPLLVSKLFGRSMYIFSKLQRYRIIEELFKTGVLFEDENLYKEIGDYLGLDKNKIRSRHEKLQKVLTCNRTKLCDRGQKAVTHLTTIIQSNNFCDENNVKKIQNTNEKGSLINNEANLRDLFNSIKYKEKSFIIRKLYREQPWSQKIDNTLRKLLMVTSYKFTDMMWNLRAGNGSFKLFDQMALKCKQNYADVKPFLTLKIKEWENGAESTTNNILTQYKNLASSAPPSLPTVLHPKFIKPDPDLDKVDKNKVMRYIWHHIPYFDFSWCKLIAQTLGYNLATACSLRSKLAARSAKATLKFDPDAMNESELRIAKELIVRIQKEKTYKEPDVDHNGLDSPLYKFGILDYKLSKTEGRNVLMLLLQKAMPFGSVWATSISTYLGISKIQVIMFRQRAVQKKLKYDKFIINPSEKEKELATHMAKIIMSWRDEAGNPYDARIDAKLEEFRVLVSKYKEEHHKTPDDQLVFEWASSLNIPDDETCYSVVNSVKTQFLKRNRKSKLRK